MPGPTPKQLPPRVNWQRAASLARGADAAPSRSGIYALGRATHTRTLPQLISWVYVGISRDIRRRLKNHLPHAERNPELRKWLNTVLPRDQRLEVWYAPLPLDQARALERYLIQSIPNLLNIQHNRSQTNDPPA